jgi:hypothetical protein
MGVFLELSSRINFVAAMWWSFGSLPQDYKSSGAGYAYIRYATV